MIQHKHHGSARRKQLGRGRVLVIALVVSMAGFAVAAPGSALALNGPCPGGPGNTLGATSWTNSSGGSWDDAANWSDGTPDPSCTASITLPGTYTVVMPAGADTAGLSLGGTAGAGTQTLQIVGSTASGNAQDSLLNPSYSGGTFTIGASGVLQLTSSGSNPGGAGVGGSIVSSGLIRTDPGAPGPSTYRRISANVTNNAGATIALHTNMDTCGCGSGGTWINNGTITTDASTTSTFTRTGAGISFTQPSGTFNNNGAAQISGAFTNSGGTTTGNPIELAGNLDASSSGHASFEFDDVPALGSDGGALTNDIGANTTVLIHNNTAANGSINVSVPADITNHGTLTLDGGPGQDQLLGSGGHTLTNAGTLNLSADSGAPSMHITTALANTGIVNLAANSNADATALLTQSAGAFNIGAGATFSSVNGVSLSGGTIANTGTFDGANFSHTGGSTTGNRIELCGGTLTAPGPGTASFEIVDNASCNGGNIAAGSTVGGGDDVRFRSFAAQNDVGNGSFTNDGTITLQSSAGHLVQLHGNTLTNNGTLNFIGSSLAMTLINHGTVNIPNAPGLGTYFYNLTITQDAGTLTDDGAVSGASLNMTGGTLRGVGTFTGTVTNSGGTVHPGHSPGVLTITGDYTQGAGGTLAADVAGTTPGSGYSQLAVSGNVTIGGALAITTGAGFTPPTGHSYQVLTTGGSVTGHFATVTGANPGGGVHYVTQYNPQNVTLAPTFDSFAVSVTKAGTGSGTVTSDTGGINCGATCSATFSAGQRVTLTATSAVGSTFAGWSGSGCSGTGSCTVTISGAQSVAATFVRVIPPNPKAPTLSALRISPRSFAAASSGASGTPARATRKKHRHPGATVTYKLDIAATVRFTVKQSLPGRVQRHGSHVRCVGVSRHNHKAHRCTRVLTLTGSFTLAGKAGTNQFHFSGRLNGHKLKPGSYTLVATPSVNGKTGRAVATRFRIT